MSTEIVTETEMKKCVAEICLTDHLEKKLVTCSRPDGHDMEHVAEVHRYESTQNVRIEWTVQILDAGHLGTARALGCDSWVSAPLPVQLYENERLGLPTMRDIESAALSPPYGQYCELERGHRGPHVRKLIRVDPQTREVTKVTISWD